MRLRQRHTRIEDNETVVSAVHQTTVKDEPMDNSAVITAQPVGNLAGLFRRVITNPDFTFQVMVIILTLASDNVKMDRRIDTMTNKIDAVRNITEVINNTMKSVKAAAEAPKHIRRLLQ
ncbi:MAG: hypothetical protein ABFC84_17075 [Veillonellales bacterium]